MTIPANVIRNRQPDAKPTPLMGWYMPLAGVRYYKMMTDVDSALGNGRIGSVGWRDAAIPKAERPLNETAAVEAATTPAPAFREAAVPASRPPRAA